MPSSISAKYGSTEKSANNISTLKGIHSKIHACSVFIERKDCMPEKCMHSPCLTALQSSMWQVGTAGMNEELSD